MWRFSRRAFFTDNSVFDLDDGDRRCFCFDPLVCAPSTISPSGSALPKVGYAPALYAKLKDHPTLKLDGNHDVFGAGAVVILSAPGHTPGRQSLLVRLPRQGFWINHDRAQSASIVKAPGFVE